MLDTKIYIHPTITATEVACGVIYIFLCLICYIYVKSNYISITYPRHLSRHCLDIDA